MKISDGHPYHFHIGRIPGIELRYKLSAHSLEIRSAIDVVPELPAENVVAD